MPAFGVAMQRNGIATTRGVVRCAHAAPHLPPASLLTRPAAPGSPPVARTPPHTSPSLRVAAAPSSRSTAPAKAAASVKMVIQGRKLQVTEAIRSYVESKIAAALAHYVQEIKEVDVTLSARGGDTGSHGRKQQKVEVTVYTVRNGVVRVEDAEDTLYASIDLAADKLARKMGRIKERAIAKGKWPGRAGPKAAGAAAEEAEFQAYRAEVAAEVAEYDRDEAVRAALADLNAAYPASVVRAKVVDLDPMSVEDAIDAMEAVGHAFFVFRELESDSIQVVYRRATTGYGLLVPRKRD